MSKKAFNTWAGSSPLFCVIFSINYYYSTLPNSHRGSELITQSSKAFINSVQSSFVASFWEKYPYISPFIILINDSSFPSYFKSPEFISVLIVANCDSLASSSYSSKACLQNSLIYYSISDLSISTETFLWLNIISNFILS